MADKSMFPWKREVIGVLVFAGALFAFLSLYIQGMGIVGHYTRQIAQLLFGRASFVIFLLLMYGSLRIIRGTHRRLSPIRFAGFLLVFVTALTWFHIISVYNGYQLPPALTEELAYARSGQGSGMIGAVLMTGVLTAFGLPGSYVILTALLIIGIILWFHMSIAQMLLEFRSMVFRQPGRLWRALVQGVQRRREAVRERFRDAQERRRQQRAGKRQNAAKAKTSVESAEGRAGSPSQAMDPESKPEDRQNKKKNNNKNKNKSNKKEAEANPSFDLTEEASRERSSVPSPEPSGSIKIPKVRGGGYHLPPSSLLKKGKSKKASSDEDDQSQVLEETFRSFGIDAKVVQVSRGPVITRYELQPARGIKVSKITGLADDISLALAAADVRIEAPVPGKSVVGIEVPNRETEAVFFRDVLDDTAFAENASKVALGLGKDIAGHPVVADLKKWLHILVAGSTGSGKSVCLNSMIASLLYEATPDEVKLLMIDPKRVELAIYDGIPHLLSPVVTDPKKAASALRWAVAEMERRYKVFERTGVRNIDMYQEWVSSQPKPPANGDNGDESDEQSDQPEHLPYIVIIIDELADLMMVAAAEVEDAVCRLAQMARAAGMYLIIATQRPSVDVITGLIKANVPSRIAFAVSSQVDSRTILDMGGADRLIGKGDMLYFPIGASKPTRAQGAWISDKEIEALVKFWKQQGEPEYQEDLEKPEVFSNSGPSEKEDELLKDAVQLVVDTGQASISMLQRRLRIGYGRAARLIDMMELRGVVGTYQGSKPREVLIDSSDLEGTRDE